MRLLDSAGAVSPEELEVVLEHWDDPCPHAAVQWFAEVSGFEPEEPVRIERPSSARPQRLPAARRDSGRTRRPLCWEAALRRIENSQRRWEEGGTGGAAEVSGNGSCHLDRSRHRSITRIGPVSTTVKKAVPTKVQKPLICRAGSSRLPTHDSSHSFSASKATRTKVAPGALKMRPG